MNVELQSIDWASVIVRRAKKDNIDNGGWHIFHTFWVGADLLNPINNAGINTKGDGACNLGLHPFWVNRYGAASFPVADRIHHCGFFLPNHAALTVEDIDIISRVVLEAA